MRNEKGQALVEFILVLPVFLLFILGTIDLGTIIYKRYQLENNLDYVIDLYKNEKEEMIEPYLLNNKISYEKNKNNDYITIKLKKTTKIITPGLSNILGKNYQIEVERTFYETE